MPRSITPYSTRTMYGTRRPVSVVVVATSVAGAAGLYGRKPGLAGSLDRYTNRYTIGVSHWASVGGPSGMPGRPCVRHTHGCTWGPAKTGPPIGWLVIVTCAPTTAAPWRSVARTTFGPTTRPVTTPSSEPSGCRENAAVSSRPPTVTRTSLAWWRDGSATRTRASPPEIRSARLEST